jgi:hypothetical protein
LLTSLYVARRKKKRRKKHHIKVELFPREGDELLIAYKTG